jgi:hypothetical protein
VMAVRDEFDFDLPRRSIHSKVLALNDKEWHSLLGSALGHRDERPPAFGEVVLGLPYAECPVSSQSQRSLLGLGSSHDEPESRSLPVFSCPSTVTAGPCRTLAETSCQDLEWNRHQRWPRTIGLPQPSWMGRQNIHGQEGHRGD